MSVKNLEEVHEKLKEKQDLLAKAFEEAKSQTDSGESVYDLNKVRVFGSGLSQNAVAEKVRELNDECNDLGKQAENLEAVEKAGRRANEVHDDLPHPTGDEGRSRKSIGAEVVGSKRYREWVKDGAKNGLSFRMDEVYPSDMLAKAGGTNTIREKTLFETGAGWAPESTRIPGFVEATTRPIQVLDIVPMAQTGQDQIVYMEETTRTHAAAETAEGGTYPEAAFAFTEQTSPVRKVATSIPVTDEQLEDVAQAEGFLNNRLTFGLRQRLDAQVVIGDGVAPNLTGIANTTGIQSQARGTDPIPDAIHKAMTLVRLNGRAATTHVIMHPNDWQSIRLLRTSEDQYIWGNPSDAGNPRIWGLPIVQSDAMAAGTAYLGAFTPEMGALYERRGVDIQVGFVGTQFVEGKRTMRADMRAAFVLFRPSAFAEVTGL